MAKKKRIMPLKSESDKKNRAPIYSILIQLSQTHYLAERQDIDYTKS